MVTWHLKGAGIDVDKWLSYTERRRRLIVDAVRRRIKHHNDLLDE